MARKKKTTRRKSVSKSSATRSNGTLKKGFRYVKGGRIIPSKK